VTTRLSSKAHSWCIRRTEKSSRFVFSVLASCVFTASHFQWLFPSSRHRRQFSMHVVRLLIYFGGLRVFSFPSASLSPLPIFYATGIHHRGDQGWLHVEGGSTIQRLSSSVQQVEVSTQQCPAQVSEQEVHRHSHLLTKGHR
jgi:hypothetical protein